MHWSTAAIPARCAGHDRREREIADDILKTMGRGVTMLNATGAYTGDERRVLLVAIRPSELYQLRTLVEEHDPDAFMIVTSTDEVLGKGFKRHRNESTRCEKLQQKRRYRRPDEAIFTVLSLLIPIYSKRGMTKIIILIAYFPNLFAKCLYNGNRNKRGRYGLWLSVIKFRNFCRAGI